MKIWLCSFHHTHMHAHTHIHIQWHTPRTNTHTHTHTYTHTHTTNTCITCDGLVEREEKNKTNQYEEEKRWVFSFDVFSFQRVKTNTWHSDRERKRVPDHWSNVLKGSQGPPAHPRTMEYLRLSEESKKESRDVLQVPELAPGCWPLTASAFPWTCGVISLSVHLFGLRWPCVAHSEYHFLAPSSKLC